MPNPIRGILAGVATAFTLSEPAGADGVAYGMSSPVAITAVAIDRTTSPMTIYSSVPRFVVDGVTLTFVDRSSIPATTVTFRPRDGGYTRTVVDKGTFSPGVQIKHWFSANGLNAFSNPLADIAEVDFADGTSWPDSSDLVKR